MQYLILINQNQFLVLGHILAEISQLKNSYWPKKFKKFEYIFNGFKRQRIPTKPKVANLILSDDVQDFMNVLIGYENMIDECLIKNSTNQLVKSKRMVNELKKDIRDQLFEQNYTVK